MEKYFQLLNRNARTVLHIYLFFSILTSSTAQNITNETNVFIPAGIEVYTGGDLVNTGFIQNNGSISFEGDWLNRNLYQGTGIVSLEGFNQTVSNNNQALDQLVINGGGVKILLTKLSITGRIDFNEGVLVVNDNDTLCTSKDTKINGGSSLSYVDGALITEGNGYKFYPVGKNGKYHPVELLDVEGVSPKVEIEVFENLPLILTSLQTTIFQDIYWRRKTISGRFDQSPISVGYNVQEPVNLSRLIFAEGEDFSSEFSIRDNVTIETLPDFDIISSTGTLTGSILALGELNNDPPKPFYFSTTLSPNAGNADNRIVKVFGDNTTITEFNFQVFNRWGGMIFESKSYAAMCSEGWDGKQKGNMLPSGVYPYSVKSIDSSGKVIQTRGFITIIQ